MEVKSSYIGTMIALATVAFGLLAAGAWNKFIADLHRHFPQAGQRRARGTRLCRDHHDPRYFRDAVPRKACRTRYRAEESKRPSARAGGGVAFVRRFPGANLESEFGPVLHRRIDVRPHFEALLF